MMVWTKHPRREDRHGFRRRVWTTRGGGCFRVVHSTWIIGSGENEGQAALSTWYAMIRSPSGWDIISRHRKRGPAFTACERRAAQIMREIGG